MRSHDPLLLDGCLYPAWSLFCQKEEGMLRQRERERDGQVGGMRNEDLGEGYIGISYAILAFF